MAVLAHVVLFLFLVTAVYSDSCYNGNFYFYCCGDCVRSYHYGYQKCKADNGYYYYDTYDCYYGYKSVYNSIHINKMSTGAIVGIVLGSLVSLILAIAIIVSVSIHLRSRRTKTSGRMVQSKRQMPMAVVSKQIYANEITNKTNQGKSYQQSKNPIFDGSIENDAHTAATGISVPIPDYL